MSPYLHFGMVATTRIARDAHEHKGKGRRSSSMSCWSSGNMRKIMFMLWTTRRHGTNFRCGLEPHGNERFGWAHLGRWLTSNEAGRVIHSGMPPNVGCSVMV